jgi:hypothetical protein
LQKPSKTLKAASLKLSRQIFAFIAQQLRPIFAPQRTLALANGRKKRAKMRTHHCGSFQMKCAALAAGLVIADPTLFDQKPEEKQTRNTKINYKFQMSLPTMVSSSPPLNDYCDSDNESEEESDSRMDDEDEKPPVLQQANVDIFAKLVQDAMRRNAVEQRQKQIKPQRRKPQQPRVANKKQQQMDFANLLNPSNTGGNQSFDQALLEILAQGKPL